MGGMDGRTDCRQSRTRKDNVGGMESNDESERRKWKRIQEERAGAGHGPRGVDVTTRENKVCYTRSPRFPSLFTSHPHRPSSSPLLTSPLPTSHNTHSPLHASSAFLPMLRSGATIFEVLDVSRHDARRSIRRDPERPWFRRSAWSPRVRVRLQAHRHTQVHGNRSGRSVACGVSLARSGSGGVRASVASGEGSGVAGGWGTVLPAAKDSTRHLWASAACELRSCDQCNVPPSSRVVCDLQIRAVRNMLGPRRCNNTVVTAQVRRRKRWFSLVLLGKGEGLGDKVTAWEAATSPEAVSPTHRWRRIVGGDRAE
jgi:hypothetical protein